MKTIKLAKWCEDNSISYITGYRWFKARQIDGAYQTQSGTIMVPSDQKDIPKPSNIISDYKTLSLLMNKIVEFSTNKASIADFATYIMSNFQLTPLPVEQPIKVSHEDQNDAAQNHIKQFIPDPEERARLKGIKERVILNEEFKTLNSDLSRISLDEDEEKNTKHCDATAPRPFSPTKNIDWSTELDEDLMQKIQEVSSQLSGDHICDLYKDFVVSKQEEQAISDNNKVVIENEINSNNLTEDLLVGNAIFNGSNCVNAVTGFDQSFGSTLVATNPSNLLYSAASSSQVSSAPITSGIVMLAPNPALTECASYFDGSVITTGSFTYSPPVAPKTITQIPESKVIYNQYNSSNPRSKRGRKPSKKEIR